MKCSKCGIEMGFENTIGRGFNIDLCETCGWDKVPADLPEAGAKRSAYAQLSDVRAWIETNKYEHGAFGLEVVNVDDLIDFLSEHF